MVIRLGKIWSAIQELNWKQGVDTVKTGAESAKAVFDLAKTVNEKKPDAQQLKPYIEQISSLLDVLNHPIAQIVKDTIPFAPIAVTILQLICDATKKEPTIEQCVALVTQVAYLESLRSLLLEDSELLSRIGEAAVSEEVSKKIRAVGELELSDRDAKRALLSFRESEIAEAFSQVLQVRLEQAGLAASEAKLFCDRVSRTVPRVLNQELAKAADKIKPLAELYRMNGQAILGRFQSLDDYLSREIASKPDEKVFDELNLTFQDIYVQLKVQVLDQNGNKIKDTQPVDLETWAEQQLLNSQEQPHVLFIQGEAGRGKSVFCRMFSDRVRQTLYPSYTPIVIRLRHLRVLENSLTQTLENYLETWDFVTSDSSWLTDENTRFLFLLDGFDELLLEGRAGGGLKEFLQQVEDFQRNTHHRFLITGRPLSLQGIDRLITQRKSLARVAIQPMDDRIRQRWLSQWAQHFGTDETHAFDAFLQGCPNEVKDDLAREPLLLYLLARLHRERRLSLEMLSTTKKIEARVLIYDEAVKWVLEKQREDENFRLTGLDMEDLRRVLTEAALCVMQAGNEYAPIKMLEARWAKDSDNPVAALLQKARKETATDAGKALNNLLTAFYVKPASGDKGGSVEFTHKSFGEFLCAERLKEAIEGWTEAGRKRERFYVKTQQMDEEIYDLLGSPVLSQEIVEHLMALLTRSSEFKSKSVELFERLHEFYDRWCEGEFIGAPPENLPQRKMRSLKEQLPEQEQLLRLRQVDVYAGLNVMILLLELHRYAQSRDDLKEGIVFYPGGQPVKKNKEPDRLRKIISYSDCLESSQFTALVGSFLARANLTSANLNRADLINADLTSANLTSANLTRANLSSANLNSANLTSANLNSANLNSAYLISANLYSADLYSANLNSANLSDANLTSANLNSVNFTRVNLISADLTSADLIRANLYSANLYGVNLCSANLTSANLYSADLTSADLTSANLTRADLNSADFTSADLTSANLTSANFTGANLTSANLTSANFTSANLYSTNLTSANLSDANLDNADLTSASLNRAFLYRANLNRAFLYRAFLISANLSDANLENANLSFVNIKDIIWNENTNWTGVIGLETAQNVPIALKEQLGL